MERNEVIRTIQESAQDMLPRLIQRRRDFHKYAEGGWREIRTSSLIARRLSELGYTLVTGADFMEPSLRLKLLSPEEFDGEYARALAQGADPEFAPLFKDGFTGLMGVLRFGDGPTLAMRFDIDALGIRETDDPAHPANRDGYASVNPGFMHACGHDAHATVGLGVAEALVRIKDQLHGTVKLIFQPHEEGVAGAPRAMIAKGHLKDVRYFLGSHITKRTEKAEMDVDVYPGTRDMLACSTWGAVFHGKSVHAGSMPHEGHDALLAAATAVVEMNAIPRHGAGASRVSIGKFRDDSAINAISNEVSFDFEVRGQTTKIGDYMLRKAKNVIEHAAAMHECTVDLTEKGISDAFACSPSLMQRVRRVCSEDLGLVLPAEDARKCGGSEDASFFLNAVQAQGGEATFMRIMSEIGSVAHARDFQILDEEIFLPRAVTIFTALCYDLMQ